MSFFAPINRNKPEDVTVRNARNVAIYREISDANGIGEIIADERFSTASRVSKDR